MERTIESLTRLERQWLKRRRCSVCEAPALGQHCYALSGTYTLPIVDGVRDQEEEIDLGPPCNMDERRGEALKQYNPRRYAPRNAGA